MGEDFLKFSTPEIDQAAIDEVIECLRSGWLATGPRVAKFEKMMAEYLHAPRVLGLNSATAGLHLALKCCGIGEGDEVITTPMTFVASLNSIVHVGARPVLVDIDPVTRNMDMEQVEAAITPRTKAIMPVHFAGIPVDLDRLYQIAQKYELRVVEDCAHAIGSIYRDRVIGSFGDIQVFSFHPNKVMTTGEGGCLVTRDEQLAYEVSVQRFHGIDREAWNRYGKDGNQNYDVIRPGYKYNMMDLQAAIGIHQLGHLEEFIAKREQLVTRYNQILAGWEQLHLPELPEYNCRIAWYIYAPQLNLEETGVSRDEFIARMKSNNIGIGYHHHAAHLYSYYQQRYGYRVGQFPVAEQVSDTIFSLPLFSQMSAIEQDRVIEAMGKVFNRR